MPGAPLYARLGLEVRPVGSAASLAVAVGGMQLGAANRVGYYAELTAGTERLGFVAGGAEVFRVWNDPTAVWTEGLGYHVLANHVRVGGLPGGYAVQDGDIWYDGTDIQVRVGGASKNLTTNILPVGSAMNSTLRWDGSDWVEETGLSVVSGGSLVSIGSGSGVDNSLRLYTDGATYWKAVAVDQADLSDPFDLVISEFNGISSTEYMRFDKSAVSVKISQLLDLQKNQTFLGIAAPALSAAGSGSIYFDSTANRFKMSENGGAYTFLGLPASLNTNSTLRWDGSAWVENTEFKVDSTGVLYLGTTPTPPAHTPGALYWDATDGTFAGMTDVTGTIVQFGQELLVRSYNNLGAIIPNGTVVYFTGAVSSRPSLELADADDSTADRAIGIVTSTGGIAAGGTGFVTKYGLVRGINTSGWSAGDTLYISSTAGGITNVEPAAPKHKVRVGYALDSQMNGTILVDIFQGTDLASLHDVNLSGAIQGSLLYYDLANLLWKPSTVFKLNAGGQIVTGGIVQPISTKVAAYPMTNNDHTILADVSGGAFAITLPASPVTGQVAVIKKIDNSVNAVTITGTVDGVTNPTLTQQYEFKMMQYTGTTWVTIG